MKLSPTKEAYESALKTVKAFEDRQAQLKRVAKDLSYKLSKFQNVKFKIDKKKKEIIFTGVKDGKLLVAKTVCGYNDKYEEVIGKLIAAKKALNEDISDVLKLVETEQYLALNSNGWHIGGKLVIESGIATTKADSGTRFVNSCMQ